MPLRSKRSLWVLAISFLSLAWFGAECPLGLEATAYLDLHASGVDRYVGKFHPEGSEEMGEWKKWSFDPQAGEGPVCLDGSPFTVLTRERDPGKVVIYLPGGGACWQDFYACNIRASQSPPPAEGIFADSYDPDGNRVIDNPLADWSMVLVSYCDGSFFGGDNAVVDPHFVYGDVRHHRGVRNLTAAIDLAHEMFPGAEKVLLAGTSAGGYGVAGVAPFLARFRWANFPALYVFDDSGPAIFNFADSDAVQARIGDWAYTQFYPSTCADCAPDAQPSKLIEWMLDNDSRVRSALYSTDADIIMRYYLRIPTQAEYRDLLLGAHDPIHDAFPMRHKRFILSGSELHGALPFDYFYTAELDGVPLHWWLRDFVEERPRWVDLVEDPIPVP